MVKNNFPAFSNAMLLHIPLNIGERQTYRPARSSTTEFSPSEPPIGYRLFCRADFVEMERGVSLLLGRRCGDKMVPSSEPRREYQRFVKYRIHKSNAGKLISGVEDIARVHVLTLKSGF
jgi:hypothetical protein